MQRLTEFPTLTPCHELSDQVQLDVAVLRGVKVHVSDDLGPVGAVGIESRGNAALFVFLYRDRYFGYPMSRENARPWWNNLVAATNRPSKLREYVRRMRREDLVQMGQCPRCELVAYAFHLGDTIEGVGHVCQKMHVYGRASKHLVAG